MHKILTLLLFLCSAHGFTQTITLKGKITDTQDIPLESATIYLTAVKDSSIIDYTISGKAGTWELKTRKITTPVFLKVSFVSLKDHKQEYPSMEQDRDFGTIKLEDQPTELNEIVIQNEIPPIRIKRDTLEFNAASFKVRPDANVETLLKQLPGVDIDSEGKITINGKEVNQILVNGKPFFDANGQIAIKNLPAEIIDKVQVSDTKTKKEELAGKQAAGDNSSINLTIKKDRNKGLFGKVMGGYGSDERYESSALVNYFKDKMKVSLLASSNNINAPGFSMNEVFDSMGGGRNNGAISTYINSAAAGRGITRSDLAGLNYADDWFKGFESGLSYTYTGSNTKNNNRTSSTNYLPVSEDDDNPGTDIDKSYYTNSVSRSDSEKFTNLLTTDFEYEIDSTMALHFNPKFTSSTARSSNTSDSSSERLIDGRLMNESNGTSYSETDSNTFSNQLTFNKFFNSRKGRGISVTFNNNNSKNENSNRNISNTSRYRYPGDDVTVETDNRNQIVNTDTNEDTYDLYLEYTEPITDSLELTIASGYSLARTEDNRDSYDFNPLTGDYTTYNDALSNYITSDTGTFSPEAGVKLDKGKFTIRANAGTNITSFKNAASYLGQDYNLNKDYIFPEASANIRYKIDKAKSASIIYGYSASFPTATQILPVADISNPLNTVIGNPDIEPNKSHRINANFRNFDFASRSGYSIFANANFYDSQIRSYTITDATGKNTTSYRNISGTMNSFLNVNWNKSIKKDAHTYRFSLGLSAGYTIDKGFLNTVMYDSKYYRLGPTANFTYEYGDLLTINPSYNYSYNNYDYTNYRVNSASNFVHRLNLQTTSYWPKHVVFGNDFGYTYNSNIAAGFKKDFYLWNSSLGYNFLEDQLLFKIKVYDILNQNLGTSRTIGPTSITDQENTVLQRYVMFSLTYSLKSFGGKPDKPGRPGGRRMEMIRVN